MHRRRLMVTLVLAAIPASAGAPARAQETRPAAGHFEFLWTFSGGPDPLVRSQGLGVDAEGNIWVAEAENSRFQIVAPDGSFLETWGASGTAPGAFRFSPATADSRVSYGDIAFDSAGTFYVADTGNHRVQKFSADRQVLLTWGEEGQRDGQFLQPNGIALSADGIVYVTDQQRADVQMFNNEGRFLGTIGRLGVADGEFTVPSGVAAARDGTIWVADRGTNRLQQFDADGQVIAVVGRSGTGPREFDYLHGIAVDQAGRLYVTDPGTNRVLLLAPDGRLLAELRGSETQRFIQPRDVVITPSGVVVIGHQNGVSAFRLLLPTGSELLA